MFALTVLAEVKFANITSPYAQRIDMMISSRSRQLQKGGIKTEESKQQQSRWSVSRTHHTHLTPFVLQGEHTIIQSCRRLKQQSRPSISLLPIQFYLFNFLHDLHETESTLKYLELGLACISGITNMLNAISHKTARYVFIMGKHLDFNHCFQAKITVSVSLQFQGTLGL